VAGTLLPAQQKRKRGWHHACHPRFLCFMS